MKFYKETESNNNSRMKNNLNNNCKKVYSLLFERSQLILQLLNMCKQKLSLMGENFLVKGINWITNEISDSLLFKEDDYSMSKIEELKKENVDMKCLFAWLEEFSTIKLNSIGKEKLPEINHKKGLTIKDLKHLLTHKNSNLMNGNSNNPIEKLANFISFSEESIAKIETPSFNIFKLEEEVGAENTLSVISCYLFTINGLYSLIRYDKFEKFIQAITKGYNRNNPYHTDLHAADISQTCMIFLKKGNIKEQFKIDDFDQCALFISCIVHDYKHPGVNNLFLINTADPISIRYNDNSVLESYHIAQAFKLIKSNEQYNIFCDLKIDEYKVVRKRIISCILATDMMYHAKQFSYLKLKIEKYGISKGEGIEKLMENLDKLGLFSLQQEILDIVIHACDISNPTKPYEVYEKWADKVMEEFWLQGDKEKELGLPISFLCDRNTTTKAQGQVGFMEGVVLPFFTSFVELFPGLGFLIDNLQKNKKIFKAVKEEEERKKNMNNTSKRSENI